MLNTPILFIIFNRPDVTQLVFNEIRKAKPSQLFIAADGPRLNTPADIELCNETRSIIKQIDWSCEVKTLFREQNLGCGKAVSSAISWFFDNIEQGIILEDDCLPNLSFFEYCQNLLDYHKDNDRVMHIGGVNFLGDNTSGNNSYYYSAIPHVWGWATWKRAWKKYDFNVTDFYLFVREEKIYNYFSSKHLANFWLLIFKKMYYKQIDTWDYQWMYSIYNHNGISIIPSVNLISNIGFRADATHTNDSKSNFANCKTFAITPNLKHPYFQQINYDNDFYFYKNVEKLSELNPRSRNLLELIKRKIVKWFN